MSNNYDQWQDGWNSGDQNPNQSDTAAGQISDELRAKLETLRAGGLPVDIDENGNLTSPLSEAVFIPEARRILAEASAGASSSQEIYSSSPIIVRGAEGEISITRRRSSVQEETFVLTSPGNNIDETSLSIALGGLAAGHWNPQSQAEYPVDYAYYSQQAYPQEQPQYPAAQVASQQPAPVAAPAAAETQELPAQPTEVLPDAVASPVRPKTRSNVDKLKSFFDEENDDDRVVESEVVNPRQTAEKSRRLRMPKKTTVAMSAAALIASGYGGFYFNYKNTTGEAPTATTLLYVVPAVKDLLP